MNIHIYLFLFNECSFFVVLIINFQHIYRKRILLSLKLQLFDKTYKNVK